ncbi:MAG TPA: type II secretion system protein N [Desulfatiglandales bacterium]|nr:type II secretion system protein N [Desulfatiglandales bacterium]
MLKYYQTMFSLLALALIIFIAVDLFYMVITARFSNSNTISVTANYLPDIKSQQKRPLNYYSTIIGRNLFDSTMQTSEEAHAEKIEDLEPTSLKIALLGTVVGNEDNAVAVIEETDKKKQDLYKEGDTIQDATVKKILRGKVILSIREKEEILTMEEGAASRIDKEPLRSESTQERDTIMLSQSDLDESLENIHQLLSQAKVRPKFEDGKTQGLTITNIKPGSLFEKLGLQNGDIVQGIDGKNIKNTNEVLDMYNKMKSGSRVEVQILRKGEEKTINYTFR